MKNQRDKLRQYQKRITVLTDREKAIAKECLARGDTNRAKLALRRKKYQEGLIQKTDAQLAQLEQLTSDVEFALVQKDVLYGLQQGTAVLKEIHREMGGIENVEKLLGENAEARAYQEVPLSLSKHSFYTLMTAGNLRAAREQNVQPRRGRSRGRAGGPREGGQSPDYTPRRARQTTRVHTRTESADGTGSCTTESPRACGRAGAAGRADAGVGRPAVYTTHTGALSEALGFLSSL